MAKFVTHERRVEHPPWCAVPYFGSDDHDPHVSHREFVLDDPPSRHAIEAYLLLPKEPADPRCPRAPLAALEFRAPGAEPVAFTLTFGQLRRLGEVLDRLVHQGEIPLPTPTP